MKQWQTAAKRAAAEFSKGGKHLPDCTGHKHAPFAHQGEPCEPWLIGNQLCSHASLGGQRPSEPLQPAQATARLTGAHFQVPTSQPPLHSEIAFREALPFTCQQARACQVHEACSACEAQATAPVEYPSIPENFQASALLSVAWPAGRLPLRALGMSESDFRIRETSGCQGVRCSVSSVSGRLRIVRGKLSDS